MIHAILEKMASAYVETNFDHAAADFKENPSASNWTALKRSMAVLQAWHQRRSGGRDAIALLKALDERNLSQWDETIVRHFNPDGLRAFDLTS